MLAYIFPDSTPQSPKSVKYVGLISKICCIAFDMMQLIGGKKKISMPQLKKATKQKIKTVSKLRLFQGDTNKISFFATVGHN
jgi:hypothetical protein